MLNRIYNWVDERLDITPLWRDIADHEVPEHVIRPTIFLHSYIVLGDLLSLLLLFKSFPECF